MIEINSKYSSIITSNARYHLCSGGRGSGKSFSINTILVLMMLEKHRTILFLRKTLTSAHLSIIPEFLEKVNMLGVGDMFHITKTEIINKVNGSVIYFRGIQTSSNDNTANLKSINGVSILVIDEAEELTDEKTFDRIDLSVRQKGVENKVIIILNPATREHFIYTRFIEGNAVNENYTGEKANVNYIHSTYLDNIDNLDPSFVEQVELMKEKSIEKYNHQVLGGWLPRAEGVIFDNWVIGEFVDTGYNVFGMDWGFGVDPTALARISINKDKRTIYLKEELYQPKLTTSEIATVVERVCTKSGKIVADSSEPRLIEELKRLGFNIHPAIKGQGSVTAGIATLQDYKLIISPCSLNLIKEANNYAWSDKKSGVPIDKWNHLWDAIRYGVKDLIEAPRPAFSAGWG